MGAHKTTYKEWVNDDAKLTILQQMARDGATDQMMADYIGITRKTLHVWKTKYTRFAKAIKDGKEVIDAAVESAILKEALKGNVIAGKFWLERRQREKWGPKSEVDIKGAVPVEIVDDI